MLRVRGTRETVRMPIEGIWTLEIYGPFGWENHGVYIVEGGRIMGGDNRQCSFGQCHQSGDVVEARITTHYYGPPRTQFGEAREQFATELTGRLKGSEIDGVIRRPDRPQFDLQVRMTRRMDLPVA
jgi:hypothetical protein